MIGLAHGIGGRSDLPVPLWLALYAAVGVLLLTFFALVAFWREPRPHDAEAGRVLPAVVRRCVDASATRVVLRLIGLSLGGVVLAVAWLGSDDSAVNPAPTWFYVWFWVGIVPLSVLFGPVWRRLNPLRGMVTAIRAVTGDRPARPLPRFVGYWPAVASLLAYLWIELVYDHSDAPRTVALFLTGYAAVHLVAGVVYGQVWFDRGDGFEVYSTLFGRLSPFGRRADGRLVLRNPLAGLAALAPAPGLVAVVCVLLGSTAFDGLTRTRPWKDLTVDVTRVPYLLLGTAGLGAAFAIVLATYVMAVRAARGSLAPRRGAGIEARFVHSLLPIALGYTIAHYFSLAVFQGQAGYLLATDPLGRGWDLLGVAGRGIDYTVATTRTIAWVQVAAIVTGHVVGVVAAHDRAVAVFRGRDRRDGQYPLLTVMVGYTMAGIALLVGT